jgi:hypothetical protein
MPSYILSLDFSLSAGQFGYTRIEAVAKVVDKNFSSGGALHFELPASQSVSQSVSHVEKTCHAGTTEDERIFVRSFVLSSAIHVLLTLYINTL